jgi:hypothetical protein
MNPYERWRQAVWAASAAGAALLTLAILLTMFGLFVAWFFGSQAGSSTGY